MIINLDIELLRKEIFKEIYTTQDTRVHKMNSEIVSREIDIFIKILSEKKNINPVFAGFIIENYIKYQEQEETKDCLS